MGTPAPVPYMRCTVATVFGAGGRTVGKFGGTAVPGPVLSLTLYGYMIEVVLLFTNLKLPCHLVLCAQAQCSTQYY